VAVTAYYNEIDPFAAAWLKELIKAGHIAPGEVDTRSIEDVEPSDLFGFTQCHFFAGIGVWSYALRRAGWGDDRQVWTGSVPCQPWSIANVWQGGGKGSDDERHLLPAFINLIGIVKPDAVFGEQVPGSIRKGWLDLLRLGLEGKGYAVGSLVLRANAFGADHERKRLFWAADARSARWARHQPLKCVSKPTEASLAIAGDNFLAARRLLALDYGTLLPCDGTSVVMERHAVKCYGNAIVAPQAEAFIRSYMETQETREATCLQ
jgi:DNA (cytosine-5)-methyltransferase 1